MKEVGLNRIKFEGIDEFQHEMLDFPKFVEKMEKRNYHEIGFFVIETPDNWNPRKDGLTSQKIRKMKHAVQRPVYQNYKELTEGIFLCTITEVKNREYNVGEFFSQAEDDPMMTEPKFKSHEEKELLFWDKFHKFPPFYGTEVEANLMDSTIFNYKKLRTILSHVLQGINPGITDSFVYLGTWMSIFNIHVEDRQLYSLNILLFGSCKVWYIVRPADGHKVQKLVKEMVKPKLEDQRFENCQDFLQHKLILISPEVLTKNGIRFSTVIQKKNEIVCTFPFAFHQGYNEGPNLAEAVNFASERWLEYGKRTEECCELQSLAFSMDEFVRLYQPKNMYKKWMSGLDVLPHPELSPQQKYEFMLQKFDEVASQNARRKRIISKQKEEMDEQEYQMNRNAIENTPTTSRKLKPIVRKKAATTETEKSVTKTKPEDTSKNARQTKKKGIRKKPGKLHQCPQCSEKFGRADHLKSHMLTHETANGFHCQIADCTYSTKWKQPLLRHVRMVHNGEKTHKCPVAGCEYAAGQNSDLAKHTKRRHKDE